MATNTENREKPWYVPKLFAPLWQALAGKVVTGVAVCKEQELPFAEGPEHIVDDYIRSTINWQLDKRSNKK